MWNIGALFSQLGTSQSLWTADGLKNAAVYFQKASGALLYARDSLAPRFRAKVESNCDLSDDTLSAASELMLAQAAECFYQKAEVDNTSSSITSQIAAQTADYYDNFCKGSRLNLPFGKLRFPKAWSSAMKTKGMLYTALGHLHCQNFMSPESVVGERFSRLSLAKEICAQALERCDDRDNLVPTQLKNRAFTVYDQVTRALEEIEKANYDSFHQTAIARGQLKPLRRPPHSLVRSINVVDGEGCNSIHDLVQEKAFEDIFDGVLGVMSMQSGRRSSLMPSEHRLRSQPISPRRSLVEVQPGTEDRTGLSEREAKFSPKLLKEVKKFRWSLRNIETKIALDVEKACTQIVELLSQKSQTIHSVADMDPELTISQCDEMMNTYRQNDEQEHLDGVRYLESSLKNTEAIVSQKLSDLHRVMWDNPNFVHDNSKNQATDQILEQRNTIHWAYRAWFNGSSGSHSLPFDINGTRDMCLQLLIQSETESFPELFTDSENPSDSCWSVNKIMTVIPCLSNEWKEKYNSQKHTVINAWQTLSGKAAPNNASSSDLLRAVCMMSHDAQNEMKPIHNEMSSFAKELKHVITMWSQQSEVQKRSSMDPIVNQLIEFGEHNSNERGSQADCLRAGIEQAQSQLHDISNKHSELMPVAKSILRKASVASPSILNGLNDTLAQIAQECTQSSEIVAVFEEQLSKMASWKSVAFRNLNVMKQFDMWLDGFASVGHPPSQQHEHEAPVLCRQSVPASDNWAEFEQIIALRSDSKEAQQKANNHRHQSNSRRPSSQPAGFRQQMLRKLSISAAAVEKHSAEAHVHFQGSKRGDLEEKHSALYQQLKELQEQQRSFAAMHNEQIQQVKTEIASSRQESMVNTSKVQGVKLGFMRLIVKPKSIENSAVSAPKPILKRMDSEIKTSAQDLFMNETLPYPSAPPAIEKVTHMYDSHRDDDMMRRFSQLKTSVPKEVPQSRRASASKMKLPPSYRKPVEKFEQPFVESFFRSLPKETYHVNDQRQTSDSSNQTLGHPQASRRSSVSPVRRHTDTFEEPAQINFLHRPVAVKGTHPHSFRRYSSGSDFNDRSFKVESRDPESLREKMDMVSRFIAYNREADVPLNQFVEDDVVSYSKRGSLGGEPYFP